MTIEIQPLRILQDNYTFLLIDNSNNQAAIIDPGSAGPVIDALKSKNMPLSHILLTHHHYDHSGGVKELKQLYPQAKVAIHQADAGRLKDACDLKLSEGDLIDFGTASIKVLHLPCHTRGHVAFQIEESLFTGDTLFNAGCGKFFEGTATEMLKNLQRLKTLPKTTQIYCGHEYTVENLEHAFQADPSNTMLNERFHQAKVAQAQSSTLVPSLLAIELATNQFLRLDDITLQKQLKTDNELDTLIALYWIFYRETPAR